MVKQKYARFTRLKWIVAVIFVDHRFPGVLPTELRVEFRGIPHLAKDERDVGHPIFCCQDRSAPPDFLSRVAASVNCMSFSLRRTT